MTSGRKIHHLAMRTRDVPALAAFYRDVFALRAVREQAGYSVWLALGDALLMLEKADEGEAPVPPATRELVAFSVGADEREAFREALRARGVHVEHETAHTLYFRDPDGRRVAVSSYPVEEVMNDVPAR